MFPKLVDEAVPVSVVITVLSKCVKLPPERFHSNPTIMKSAPKSDEYLTVISSPVCEIETDARGLFPGGLSSWARTESWSENNQKAARTRASASGATARIASSRNSLEGRIPGRDNVAIKPFSLAKQVGPSPGTLHNRGGDVCTLSHFTGECYASAIIAEDATECIHITQRMASTVGCAKPTCGEARPWPGEQRQWRDPEWAAWHSDPGSHGPGGSLRATAVPGRGFRAVPGRRESPP